VVGIFPALAGSDIVMNKKEEHIAILVDGVSGSAMMSFDSYLTDRELAAVMTYTQMAWDNNVEDASAYIFPEDITAYKAKTQ
jgi:cytochrome c oxidase subunit 2